MRHNALPALMFLAGLLIYPGCHQRKKAPAPVKKPVAVSSRHPVPQKPEAGASELRLKLRISEKELHQNKLYGFAEEWYGTPYKYGGCSKKGVDCSCFTNLLYQEVYSRTLPRSANDIFKVCDEISIEDARAGDLVFFKIGSNLVTHVGVFMGGVYFIHSSTSRGVILNSLDEAYYRKYFFCAGKIKRI